MDGVSQSILVVDDQPTNLTLLSGILKPLYTVYLANSGKTAIRITEKNKPDLILLDIMMPEMNGFDVFKALSNNATTREIPIIFLTGLNDIENEAKGLQLGAVDYIRKPFHSSIVLARLQTHLGIANKIREKDSAALLIETRKESRSIPFRELVYVDVVGHRLSFHLSSGETVDIYATLKEYEEILYADPRFARCHKAFIVNMDFIASVEIRDEVRDILLKNNEHLPVSKGYLGFKKQYAEWVHG